MTKEDADQVICCVAEEKTAQGVCSVAKEDAGQGGGLSADKITSGFFVHESSYVDEGAVIGDGTKIWHFSHIQKGAVIGKDCVIGQNVNVADRAIIGNRCKIQNNVSVYEGVELADDVFCGPSCVFTNDLFPRAHSPHGWEVSPTRIGQGASIGANATIVCGISIGEYALVGSGAVVVRDIASHALVVGNPARQIAWVCRCGARLDASGRCPKCDELYPDLIW